MSSGGIEVEHWLKMVLKSEDLFGFAMNMIGTEKFTFRFLQERAKLMDLEWKL